MLQPDSYLSRKLEVPLSDNEEERKDIEKTLKNFPPVQEGTSRPTEPGEYVMGDFRINFRFDELDPKRFYLDLPREEFIRKIFDRDSLSPEEEDRLRTAILIGGQYDPTLSDRPRMLSEFIFDDSFGHSIRLSSFCPSEYSVIYSPSNEDFSGFTDPKQKLIFIQGDISNLKTILTLLHEAGHAQVYENMTNEGRQQLIVANKKYAEALDEGGGGADAEAEVYYRNERDAWAVALALVRPLFSSRETKDKYADIRATVNKYVHDIILSINSEDARKTLDKNYKGKITEFFEKRGLSEEECEAQIEKRMRQILGLEDDEDRVVHPFE